MSIFASIDVSATGLDTARLWLEVISHNMANLDTVRPSDQEPFRALLLEVQEDSEGGVVATGLQRAGGEPQRVYDPDHPLADEDGTLIRPVVELAAEMSNLIIATRMYQVNLRAIQSSQEAYQSALRIGN